MCTIRRSDVEEINNVDAFEISFMAITSGRLQNNIISLVKLKSQQISEV